MLILAETLRLAEGGTLEIALHAGRAGAPATLRYELRYIRGGVTLLGYDNAAGHRRRLRGESAPYAFRSVEQLRYDFERDLEALADEHEGD